LVAPDFLQKGDKIAIVSTARKVDQEALFDSIRLIESWGLNVVLGKTIGLDQYQFAGSDIDRLVDFQKVLDDPAIKAIWCARGGYGTVRIIDQIDFSGFKKRPKWIIGYSDITVLHSHIHNLGIKSLHAPLAFDLSTCEQAAIDSFRTALFGEKIIHTSTFNRLNKVGYASGVVVGGNLSILYSLCGSTSAIQTAGKILCIEDLDEYLYHIDRMLQNLKRNGYFNQLSGLIVGGMTKMHDNLNFIN